MFLWNLWLCNLNRNGRAAVEDRRQKGPLLGVLLRGLLRRGFGVRDGLPITGGRRGARRRHPARRGESPAIARRRRCDPFPVAHSSRSGLGFGWRRPLAASAAADPSGLLLPGACVSGGSRLIPWPVAPSSRAQAQDWRCLHPGILRRNQAVRWPARFSPVRIRRPGRAPERPRRHAGGAAGAAQERPAASHPQVYISSLCFSLLSDSPPCSSFPGSDDWASGGAICHVFAKLFAGHEHLQAMPFRSKLFPHLSG